MEAAIVALITKIGNEPVAFVALSVFGIAYLIKFFKDVVWPLITKRPKKVKFDLLATEIRQSLQEIKGEIDALSEAVTNHDKLNTSQSLGIFENQVFNTNLSPFRRLKGLRRAFGLRGNGEIKTEGFKIAQTYPDVWKNVMSLKMSLTVIDYEYYKTAVAEINAGVFGGELTFEPDDTNAKITGGVK